MSFISRLSARLKNSPFYSRPLCLFCTLFLLSVLAIGVSYVLFSALAFCAIVYSAFLFVYDGREAHIVSPLALLVLTAVLFGALVSLPCEIREQKAKKMCGDGRNIEMTVTETVYDEAFGCAYYVKVTRMDGTFLNVGGTLVLSERYELKEFDTVTVVGDVAYAYSELFGAELLNAKASGSCLDISAETVESVTSEARSGPRYALYRIRSFLCARFERLIGGEASSYAKALLIGEKSGLSDDFRKDMSAIGVSHILAVSGMHLSIIAAIVGFLADRTYAGKKTKRLLTALGGVMFMTVAGFSPSVVRAAIMLAVSSLSVFFGRRSDSLTSLLVSGTVICAFSPRTALSCSFLLSFFATLGLVLCASAASLGLAKRFYMSRLRDMRLPMRILRGFLGSVFVSLCATVFTALVLSVYFSEVSVFAVIANLFAVPCAFVSVSLAVVIIIFGDVPLVGRAACAAFRAVYALLKSFAGFCSDHFETSFSLEYEFFVPILLFVLCAVLFMRMNGIRSVTAFTAVLLSASLIFVTCVQVYSVYVSDRSEVVYLADKNSEAFVVSSGSETMLVDIGKGGKSLPLVGTEILQKEYYETRIDAFMLTHYHSLHIGTVRHLVYNYRIKRIYVPVPESENDEKIYNSMKKYLAETETVVYTRGEDIKVGRLTVSTSEYSVLERSTHPVMVLRISDGVRSLLWVGSSVTEADAALLANRWLSESSVVICGCHGPKEKENIPYYTVIQNVTEIFVSPYSIADGVKLFSGIYYETLEADGGGTVKKRFSFDG